MEKYIHILEITCDIIIIIQYSGLFSWPKFIIYINISQYSFYILVKLKRICIAKTIYWNKSLYFGHDDGIIFLLKSCYLI